MGHAVHTRDLGRFSSYRAATVQSLAQALVRHERINTTLARAKEAQRLAERLVTLAKKGGLADRRRAVALLQDKQGVGRLFSQIAPRFASRAGGYTRILHNGIRSGDGASMAVLEWTELSPDLDKKAEPVRRDRKKGVSTLAIRPPSAAPEAEKPKVQPPASRKKKPESAQNRPKEPKKGGFLKGLRRFFGGDQRRGA
ncbi:MAG: 50S ribosomal protein L17 [Candidatus Omnitrophica bacterium CG11_big_fil_rev_8_21_14_0_20_64_10]|nr:MAG: 50S ribosomal protein L17 [Candidatus Omnitrophica bacterium CG11_big_fil_rev_8_21_14_0_20_64_10]